MRTWTTLVAVRMSEETSYVNLADLGVAEGIRSRLGLARIFAIGF